MWWCPWIHDLGLMAGCVRHGLMNINAMRGDASLPLNPGSIRDHITRTLVVRVEPPQPPQKPAAEGVLPTAAGVAPAAVPGTAAAVGAAAGGGAGAGQLTAAALAAAAAAVRAGKGLDGSDGRVQAWVGESCLEFPTRRAAEDRVFRICVALTKLMPLSNPLRVRCYNNGSGTHSTMIA